MMKYKSAAAILMGAAISRIAMAGTEAPPGPGQAIYWVTPCSALDHLTTTNKPLIGTEGELAEFCLGAFTAIMQVNYFTPPSLPFCVDDDARPIDFVRTYLAFMRAHPEYNTKTFGLIVLTALAQAYPKSKCD